jgi:hypothetical protein
MLDVLFSLLQKEFDGSLERNGAKLSVIIHYSPPDVMTIGPMPEEMELPSAIAYLKFDGDSILASASLGGDYTQWRQGLQEGVQTLRLLDPRVYAVLLKNRQLRERDPISTANGLTRVFADYPTEELGRILGMPDEVGRVFKALSAELHEIAFDFGHDQHGRPQSMIQKELSPSEDEIAVRFRYP